MFPNIGNTEGNEVISHGFEVKMKDLQEIGDLKDSITNLSSQETLKKLVY